MEQGKLKETIIRYLELIVIAILSLLLFYECEKKEVVVQGKEIITTDTVYATRIDTLYDVKPTFITETIVDTIYIEKSENCTIPIPKYQRFYSTEDYKAWVSGYEPQLDSIITFNKVITKVVTNNVETKVYPKSTDLYFNTGVLVIDKKFAPNIGATVKFKNDMTLGGKVGLYDKSVYYGVDFGFKIK